MKKTSFSVRDYTPEDFDELTELWNSTGVGSPERGDRADIIDNTLRHGGKLFIAENTDTGEIIGASWITNDGRRLYIHHFAIKAAYQGRGFAKPLLEESLRFCKETGLQVKLEVHKDNVPAILLYKKYGFKSLDDFEVWIIRDYSETDLF